MEDKSFPWLSLIEVFLGGVLAFEFGFIRSLLSLCYIYTQKLIKVPDTMRLSIFFLMRSEVKILGKY